MSAASVSAASADGRPARAFWWLLTGWTALRLALAGTFGFSTDEAHYVMYGRRLAWGYLDHPPLVGFLGAVGDALGGGVFAMRLLPILCWSASLVLLRRLALSLRGDERSVFWAAAWLVAVPVVHPLATSLLPDAPLNVFWLGALLAFWSAVERGRWSAWLTAGACVGGALLAKYHGVLLPLCFLVHLVATPRHRPWLRRSQPYVALLVAALVFLPNVLWNVSVGWASYAFQLGRGAGTLDAARMLENAGGQLLALSPVLAVLVVAAWAATLRRRPLTPEDTFLVATSLPVFGFFLLTGLTGKLLPHWTAVGLWSGSLLFVRTVEHSLDAGGGVARRWRRWTRIGAGVGLAFVVLLHASLYLPLTAVLYRVGRDVLAHARQLVPAIPEPGPFEPGFDPTNELHGWSQVAEQVEALRASLPDPEHTFVFSDRFFTVSSIGPYVARDLPLVSFSTRPDQYRLWFDAAEHAGWDAIYVSEDRFRKRLDRNEPLFERFDPEPVHFEALRQGQVARAVELYRYYGFRGELPRVAR